MQTADMAAAAITVSEERQTAVDFTRPFMTFDSAILMKKSTNGCENNVTRGSGKAERRRLRRHP
jgi:ABC-type amino acid transport substrate-binding protein